MLRHVALFRWKPEMSRDDLDAVAEGLGALPGLIGEIRSYEFGADLGISPGNFDFAVVADFDDEDDYRTYLEHPTHQRVIHERIVPFLLERAAVQLAAESSAGS